MNDRKIKNPDRQSTKVKDKNNVEILVGDIVKVTYGNKDSNWFDVEKVIWKNNKFYLESQDGISSLDSPHYTYETIGNINDNPNLYKDGYRMTFWDDE